MDTSFFRGLQLLPGAILDPLTGDIGIAEPDGAYGAGGISRRAGFAAWGIVAKEASRGFLMNVHHNVVFSILFPKISIFGESGNYR